MRNSLLASRHFIAAGVAATLMVAGVSEALAQASRQAERQSRAVQNTQTQAEAKYPQAERDAPKIKASARMAPKLKRLFKAYDTDSLAEAQVLADEVLADPDSNGYDKAVSARLIGSMLLGSDDTRATTYLQQSIDFNSLPNNEHYESMLVVAQLQLQTENYQEAFATVDRFLTETKSQEPAHRVLKGSALYELERYTEVIAELKPVIEASAEPRPEWVQLLMAAYAEAEQPAEAARLAEQIAAKAPADKRAQLNLAAAYLQGEQYDKAAEVYERLHAAGELTEERDYRNLYAIYLNTEGKEAQAIAAINEGLQKGILKPDHQVYVALAQAYYFSGQPGPAIEAYRKAAPLAENGETWLNLAKALANEGQTAESKQAAQQALDKGIRNPEDARKLLAR